MDTELDVLKHQCLGVNLEQFDEFFLNVARVFLTKGANSRRQGDPVPAGKVTLAGTKELDRSSLLDLLPICFVIRQLRILFQYAPSSFRADRKNLLRNAFPPNCIVPD